MLTLNQFTAADADHVTMKYRELIVFAKKSGGKFSVMNWLATKIIAEKLPDAMGVDVRYEPLDAIYRLKEKTTLRCGATATERGTRMLTS